MRTLLQFLKGSVETEGFLADADIMELFRSKSVEEVLATMPDFDADLRQYDAIHLLGLSAIYARILSDNPSLDRKRGWEIEVADLEILQALLLTEMPSDDQRIIDADDVQRVWTSLRQLHFAVAMWDGPGELTAEQKTLGSQFKIHSAYYRNQYGRKFFGSMVQFIAQEFDHRSGSRVLPFFTWLLAIFDEINRRFDTYRQRVKTIVEGDISLVADVAKDLARGNINAAKLFASANFNELSADAQRTFCFNLHEACAEETFRFTPNQVRSLSLGTEYDPLPDLQHISLTFGDLANRAIADLSHINPIWEKPFVRLGDDFFLFSPLTVMSFPFRVFLAVAPGDPVETRARLEAIRGTFVEKECFDLLRALLPSADVRRNVYWYDIDGSRCQTDVVAVLPDRLIAFEAKGAILPDRVRTGNVAKSKSFLKQNYGVASAQVDRFVDRVKHSQHLKLLDESGTVVCEVVASQLREIIGYSVTIDQIGTIANARRLQIALEIVSAESNAPPIMLADLATILPMLDREVYRLHYLIRRHQLYSSIDVLGDEMDIFSIYILFGFTAIPLDGNEMLGFVGASYYLSEYVNEDGLITVPSESTLANTKYFERVLGHVTDRKPPGYLEIAFSVLDAPSDAQSAFEESMKELRRLARRSVTDRLQVCVTQVSSGLCSLVLVGSIYGDIEREVRNSTLVEALSIAMRKHNSKSGILIGRQLGFENHVYSVALYLGGKDLSESLLQKEL